MRDTFTPPDLKIGGRGVLTGLKAGDVAKYVLLVVRDPLGYDRDAADEIATYLDDAVLLADTGLFRTFSGSYKGVRVTVCSTGSGAPDTELALVDLAELSPEGVFIRVGTSGSANDRVRVGDLVIASGAVRSDGASREYVDAGYPAVASPEVTLALAEAATRLGHSHHVGITRSNDSLYAGQGRPVLGYFVPGSEGVATGTGPRQRAELRARDVADPDPLQPVRSTWRRRQRRRQQRDIRRSGSRKRSRSVDRGNTRSAPSA